MFPPVHPALAYLLYSGFRRARDGPPPSDLSTLAVVLGAVLPDIVDQPLFALFDLPSTRTVGHSLLVALPVCLAVLLLVRRSDLPDQPGFAFAVGYLSHLAADAFWPLTFGHFHELGFLAWPLTASPPYPATKPLSAISPLTVTTRWIELALLVLGVVVWWADGLPGLGGLRSVGSG